MNCVRNSIILPYRIELSFEDSVSKEVVLSTIKNLRYVEGNTRTGLALETSARMFEQIREQSERAGANQVRVLMK